MSGTTAIVAGQAMSESPSKEVSVVASSMLRGYQRRAVRDVERLFERVREVPALEAKCAALGKSMVEEDIDVALFLFTNGEPGEMAWFSSVPNGREVVERWVALERGRSMEERVN